MKSINLKFGNMRKAQDFTIYPFKEGDATVTIQSHKAIAQIQVETGKMIYNTKGCYFHHLNKFCGAEASILPAVDLQAIKMLIFVEGSTIVLGGGAVTADNSGAKNIFDL
jgi:hypothetical protein